MTTSIVPAEVTDLLASLPHGRNRRNAGWNILTAGLRAWRTRSGVTQAAPVGERPRGVRASDALH